MATISEDQKLIQALTAFAENKKDLSMHDEYVLIDILYILKK